MKLGDQVFPSRGQLLFWVNLIVTIEKQEKHSRTRQLYATSSAAMTIR